MADLQLKFLDKEALDRINARLQNLPQPQIAPTAQPTVAPRMPAIQPAPTRGVNLWDVLKEVPRAALQVGKETVQGIVKPFAKAGVTATKTVEGVGNLAAFGVAKAFGQNDKAQAILNANPAATDKQGNQLNDPSVSVPGLGKIKPISKMGEALLTGTEIGLTLTPAKAFNQLARISFSAKGLKVLPEILSTTERRLVETAGEEALGQFRGVRDRVINAITNARDVFGQQAELRSEELAKRIAAGEKAAMGKTGSAAELARRGELSGEMPNIQFESILKDVKPDDFEVLNRAIQDSPMLSPLQKTNASQGLRDLFGSTGGAVPTNYDLEQVAKVLGDDFVKAVLKKRPLIVKMRDKGIDFLAGMKTLASAGDLSVSFRQLLPFVGRKEFWKNFPKQFKYWLSEGSYKARQEELMGSQEIRALVDNGLDLTGMGAMIRGREEAFAGTWPEKIPLVGQFIVKPSERAFTGLANDVKADVALSMFRQGEAAGLKPMTNRNLLKQISDFVNDGAGRGKNLFGGETGSGVGNALLWSPKLISSRLRILYKVFDTPVRAGFDILKPGRYVKENALVRKEALKTALGFASFIGTTLGFAKAMGADVSLNPTSSDFLKIRSGDVRYDVLGGFQQYIVFLSRFIAGYQTSSSTGAKTYYGEGYKADDRLQLSLRLLQSKASPMASFAISLLRGQNYDGEKLDSPLKIGSEFVQGFFPLIYRDMWELMQDQSFLKAIGMSIPDIFGVGIQIQKGVSPEEMIKAQTQSEKQHIREKNKKSIEKNGSEIKMNSLEGFNP